jgi:hypothetical protein
MCRKYIKYSVINNSDGSLVILKNKPLLSHGTSQLAQVFWKGMAVLVLCVNLDVSVSCDIIYFSKEELRKNILPYNT